jgi:hypothetical protein
MKTSVAAVLITLSLSANAYASCQIKNETSKDFTVEYGNVSNRSFGANNVDTFPAGSISGKSKDGASFSGSCNDGDRLVIKEENGTIKMKKR